jgi:hypothetical protein
MICIHAIIVAIIYKYVIKSNIFCRNMTKLFFCITEYQIKNNSGKFFLSLYFVYFFKK